MRKLEIDWTELDAAPKSRPNVHVRATRCKALWASGAPRGGFPPRSRALNRPAGRTRSTNTQRGDYLMPLW